MDDVTLIFQAICKRRISVLRQNGNIKGTVEGLITYLDTFYGDPEAWLELADVYASMAMSACCIQLFLG